MLELLLENVYSLKEASTIPTQGIQSCILTGLGEWQRNVMKLENSRCEQQHQNNTTPANRQPTKIKGQLAKLLIWESCMTDSALMI